MGMAKEGGLALYWDETIKVETLSYGLHHIDTLIRDNSNYSSWRGTFVYGEPRT